MGGPSRELTTEPFPTRRTVYGYIDRQNLQGFYRTFDFASPDASSPQRYRTTVPQQALFMMNSPFVVEQARALAHREDVTRIAEPAARLRYLYRAVYGRNPDAVEAAEGLQFLTPPARTALAASGGGQAAGLDRWTQLVQVLLMSNEFAFVD